MKDDLLENLIESLMSNIWLLADERRFRDASEGRNPKVITDPDEVTNQVFDDFAIADVVDELLRREGETPRTMAMRSFAAQFRAMVDELPSHMELDEFLGSARWPEVQRNAQEVLRYFASEAPVRP